MGIARQGTNEDCVARLVLKRVMEPRAHEIPCSDVLK